MRSSQDHPSAPDSGSPSEALLPLSPYTFLFTLILLGLVLVLPQEPGAQLVENIGIILVMVAGVLVVDQFFTTTLAQREHRLLSSPWYRAVNAVYRTYSANPRRYKLVIWGAIVSALLAILLMASGVFGRPTYDARAFPAVSITRWQDVIISLAVIVFVLATIIGLLAYVAQELVASACEAFLGKGWRERGQRLTVEEFSRWREEHADTAYGAALLFFVLGCILQFAGVAMR